METEDMLRFFHCKKTEMSCMENPKTFLSQLRDHDLIPESGYQKLSHMRSKERLKRGLYETLDWLERERSERIHDFWSCAFEDTITNLYPTLRMLRNSVLDGSFRVHTQLTEKVEKEQRNKSRRKQLPDEGEKQLDQKKKRKLRRVFDDDDDDDDDDYDNDDDDSDDNQPGPSSQFTPGQRKKSKKKEKKKLRSGRVFNDSDDDEQPGPSSQKKSKKEEKRKLRSGRVFNDDDEQPGPSSQFTPGQKKSKKVPFSPPIKKGEKKEVWTWPLYQTLMPVTCGELDGSLNRNRMAKGVKCVYFKKQWLTPGEFEKRAGMERMKNWKWSIRCGGIPLGKLIQKDHLKSVSFKRGSTKAKRSLFPSTTDEDEHEDDKSDDEEAQSSSNKESSTDDTDEEESEQEQGDNDDIITMVFKVTCGATSAILHKKRFASGTHGKSIRTESSWMSPKEFVKVALPETDSSWKKDIKWEGKPLSVLIKENILRIHSELCECPLCCPDPKHLDNQKNDDECYLCRSEEESQLVECDDCPRSFHQRCHLPHIEDSILGDDRPWMCTFCEFSRHGNGDEQEVRAGMSQHISRHTLKCHYLLLLLCCADKEQTPASNPNNSASSARMWADEVAHKLQEGEYQTVREFASDVQRLLRDCADSSRGEELVAWGDPLKELFNREFKKVFNIREQADD